MARGVGKLRLVGVAVHDPPAKERLVKGGRLLRIGGRDFEIGETAPPGEIGVDASRAIRSGKRWHRALLQIVRNSTLHPTFLTNRGHQVSQLQFRRSMQGTDIPPREILKGPARDAD